MFLKPLADNPETEEGYRGMSEAWSAGVFCTSFHVLSRTVRVDAFCQASS